MAVLTSFEVENATEEDLVITPIGARGPEGVRGKLPISSFSRFYVMSLQEEFVVPAGSSVSITYDYDDVQFSEIVCRRSDGSHWIVPTGLHPTQGQYRPPPIKKFEIADLSALQPATDLHLSPIQPRRGRVSPLDFLPGLGLLSPLCFWIASRIRCTDTPAPPRAT